MPDTPTAPGAGTARVPLLAVEDATGRAEQAGVPGVLAHLNIFRALLHAPPAAKATSDALLALLAGSHLDHRLRELVIMRIGWVTGSVYEWTQHWRVARDLGVSDEDLLAVRDWRGHEGFGPADRAVLAATDETLAGGPIAPATWAACEEHLPGPEALVELVLAIGLWQLVSGVLRSLEIPLEDGMAPWPPDGAAPAGASGGGGS